jgi:CubicO group peptidase (beta-lactamase class C family)
MSCIISTKLLPSWLCLIVTTCFCLGTRHLEAQTPPLAWPGADWEKVDKPESVGYSTAKLEALCGWLKTQRTTAMLVSVHGKVLFSYGDLAFASKVASVRKSILSMLYGKYVIDGTIDLNKTVKQIGLDDVQKFLPREELATLELLLTARSGIYHPSGNQDLDAQAPIFFITTGISTQRVQHLRSSPKKTSTRRWNPTWRGQFRCRTMTGHGIRKHP